MEELDIGRCHNITDAKLLEMKSMPKLNILNYFKKSMFANVDNYEDMKKKMPQLTNNDPWRKTLKSVLEEQSSHFE